jgi:hypothetical protein
MQKVNFNSVEEFLDFLPEQELKITEKLRKIIFDCLPQCTEKLSYNVPYYKIHKNVCFIWPASVLWGKQKTYEGMRFGFTFGYLLQDEIGFLDKGNRKQVYYKDYTNITAIEPDILKAYIYESALIDEQLKKEKRNAQKFDLS